VRLCCLVTQVEMEDTTVEDNSNVKAQDNANKKEEEEEVDVVSWYDNYPSSRQL
jgi:hypothetical protein